jgi:hypothetical protein
MPPVGKEIKNVRKDYHTATAKQELYVQILSTQNVICLRVLYDSHNQQELLS